MRSLSAHPLLCLATPLLCCTVSLMTVATVGGCASTQRPTDVNVVPTSIDGEWLIASVRRGNEVISIPAGTAQEVRIHFTPDPSGTGLTELNGFAAVNRFFGSAAAGDDGSFSVEGLGTTRMAGPAAAMSFENSLLAALRDADSWRGDASGIVLSGPNSKVWLVPAGASR